MSSFVICRLAAANIYQRTQRVRRSVRSADCGGPGECASDVRSRGIAPARKELRNGSSKSERESTSGRSTNYGSGHLNCILCLFSLKKIAMCHVIVAPTRLHLL